MRVLLVKLTSMGDLIHALPALTDAMQAIPGITFDWVIEKNFSEVASWHPAVKTLIPTSHRVWRKQLRASFKNGEIQLFLKNLRKESYDLIIDGQASLKSAVITLLARGKRFGLDKFSARERFASLAYQQSCYVDKDLHAIQRLRLLFSYALGYTHPKTPVDYGIANYPFKDFNYKVQQPYIVLVHNASWQSKLWPEAYCRKLIILAAKEGIQVLLPWGNLAEKNRALQISANQSNAHVLPFCQLSEHAYLLKNSLGAICCDTGLSHLAAALNVPAVTLYGPTSPKLIGTQGLSQTHLVTPHSCATCYKTECNFEAERHTDSVCLSQLKPEMVWASFKALVKGF
jgi:heptosyltransferase-1